MDWFFLLVFFILVHFLLSEFEGGSSGQYVTEGRGRQFTIEDVVIDVLLKTVKSDSVVLYLYYSRGNGRWVHMEELEVETRGSTKFLVFPTPNLPRKHTFQVFGERSGNMVKFTFEKRGGWKIPFVGGPGFT